MTRYLKYLKKIIFKNFFVLFFKNGLKFGIFNLLFFNFFKKTIEKWKFIFYDFFYN